MKKSSTTIPTFAPEERPELYLVRSTYRCAKPGFVGLIHVYDDTQVRMMGKRRKRKQK